MESQLKEEKKRIRQWTELTFDERKKIENLLPTRISLTEISRILGRGKNTIIVEIRRNGGREKYTAAKAEERARIISENHYDQLRVLNQKNKISGFRYKERVENLEMQVEILIDEIRRLSGDKENI